MENNKFEIQWHGVTWYSKTATLIVVLATFVIAFGLGALYERINIENRLLAQPVIVPLNQ